MDVGSIAALFVALVAGATALQAFPSAVRVQTGIFARRVFPFVFGVVVFAVSFGIAMFAFKAFNMSNGSAVGLSTGVILGLLCVGFALEARERGDDPLRAVVIGVARFGLVIAMSYAILRIASPL